MLYKVAEKLYVASCRSGALPAPGSAVIYCCSCPPRAPGPQPCSPPSGETPRHYLSLANTEIPDYRPEDFNRYLDLLDRNLQEREVVLVSEQGESRAPSLAMLWMAFRGGMLSRSSFAAARADFSRIYPRYRPWPGWVIFFNQEWDAFH
jgi:hypothetical protein